MHRKTDNREISILQKANADYIYDRVHETAYVRRWKIWDEVASLR